MMLFHRKNLVKIFIFVAIAVLILYLANPYKESFAEATNTLPNCQCPIQLPPTEWNENLKTVKELVVKVNDIEKRLQPIETTFKSAENAEAKQN